ncbi:hypothetical protein FRC02_005963, partial [Tulasnella sp. 418]
RTHSILENWWVSGNIQVSTSGSDKQTTGHIARYVVPEYALATISGSTSPSEPPYRDVNVTVTADHRLYIEAEIQNGWHKKTVRWSQSHSFSNKQEYRNHAGVQNMTQVTAGSSISTHNGIPKISDKFHYPLSIDFYHIKDTRGDGYGVTFDLAFHRTELHPLHRTLSTVINSHRKSVGERILPPKGSAIHIAESDETFSYADVKGNTYTRHVKAAKGEVTYDREGGSLAKHSTSALNVNEPKSSHIEDGLARIHGGQTLISRYPGLINQV